MPDTQMSVSAAPSDESRAHTTAKADTYLRSRLFSAVSTKDPDDVGTITPEQLADGLDSSFSWVHSKILFLVKLL